MEYGWFQGSENHSFMQALDSNGWVCRIADMQFLIIEEMVEIITSIDLKLDRWSLLLRSLQTSWIADCQAKMVK
ncbi:unnamed protein product [Brassica rapa subsp. trilocularis]